MFLGDYTGRGQNSSETICLFFAYKIRFIEDLFMLRGSRETPSINRVCGFFDECKRRYNATLRKRLSTPQNVQQDHCHGQGQHQGIGLPRRANEH
mmetsp:Transcript_69039/g.192204  ORF Transcript_69039/g.192204 Transcript_69039/m.192204 type:complete len:95 (-) Transcript_69039:55-339(-)